MDQETKLNEEDNSKEVKKQSLFNKFSNQTPFPLLLVILVFLIMVSSFIVFSQLIPTQHAVLGAQTQIVNIRPTSINDQVNLQALQALQQQEDKHAADRTEFLPRPTPPIVAENTNAISTTSITQCGRISKSGTYTLTKDLNSSGVCLDFGKNSEVKNITINCQGHSITAAIYAIRGHIVDNIQLNKCFLYARYPVEIDKINTGNFAKNVMKSKSGILPNNEFPQPFRGNNITLTSNTFGNEIDIGGDHITINNNTIISDLTKKKIFELGPYHFFPEMIDAENSKNITITNNYIYGNAPGGGSTDVNTINGADDGIGLGNASNVLIAKNTIDNVWDVGIETTNNNNNLTIQDNKIDTAWVSGIGGWFANSIQNSKFVNNTVSNSGMLFDFYLDFGYLSWTSPSDFKNYYFKNNIFEGNKIYNIWGAEYASVFDIRSNQVKASRIFVANNTFKNNNFSTESPLSFFPKNDFIDKGGNVCLKTKSGNVLNCK